MEVLENVYTPVYSIEQWSECRNFVFGNIYMIACN